MQPRKSVIEPAAIQYAIYLYEDERKKNTTPAQVAVNLLYERFNTFSKTVKNTFYKPASLSDETDIRGKLCTEYSTLADNITPDNIITSLIKLGKDAEVTQTESLTKFIPKLSAFTQCAHFCRAYLLYVMLHSTNKYIELKNPESSSLDQKELQKELQIFRKKIIDEQEKCKQNLSAKINSSHQAILTECPSDELSGLNNAIDELRYKLIYLGDNTHILETRTIQTLFPSDFYYIDPLLKNARKPVLPYVITKNFAVTYIQSLYEQQKKSAELAGKNPDEVIALYEKFAKEQMKTLHEFREAEKEKHKAEQKVGEVKAKLSGQTTLKEEDEVKATLSDQSTQTILAKVSSKISSSPDSTSLPDSSQSLNTGSGVSEKTPTKDSKSFHFDIVNITKKEENTGILSSVSVSSATPSTAISLNTQSIKSNKLANDRLVYLTPTPQDNKSFNSDSESEIEIEEGTPPSSTFSC